VNTKLVIYTNWTKYF